MLAKGLAAVAGRMEPAEAARVARQAANILILALQNETDSLLRTKLAYGLVSVASRMEPAEAARLLTPTLEKEMEAWSRQALANGLAAVTGLMEPAEAARVAGRVASVLARALGKVTDRKNNALARQLLTISGRLSPAEAAAVSCPVLETVLQAADKETDETERLYLLGIVALLLSASDNRDAHQVAAKFAFAVCSGREVNASLDDGEWR